MNYSDFVQAPFITPKFDAAPREFGKHTRIFDFVELGLETDDARVLIEQKKKPSLFSSPPDHFFTLDIEATDIGQSKWFTLEFTLDPARFENASRITTLVSLAAPSQDVFNLGLRFFREDDSFEDILLGEIKALKDAAYRPLNFSQSLDVLLKRLGEKPKKVKLILFAPSSSGIRYSLAMLNFFITSE